MSSLFSSSFYTLTLQVSASALIGYLCPSAILLAGALGALAPHTIDGAKHIWFKFIKELF
jgi:hypothetical protein